MCAYASYAQQAVGEDEARGVFSSVAFIDGLSDVSDLDGGVGVCRR